MEDGDGEAQRHHQSHADRYSFPPSQAALRSAAPPEVRPYIPPTRWTQACTALPLGFVLFLFAFATYAFLVSLVIGELLVGRQEYGRGIAYAVIYIWLAAGAAGSIVHARIRGAGRVGGKLAAYMAARSRDTHTGAFKEQDEPLLSRDEHISFAAALGELEQGAQTQDEKYLQVKNDGAPRYCRKCELHKPDRAHHCSSCGYCVLRMDHHCPWLGGVCVGYANTKFFLLFLLYTGALAFFVCVATFIEITHYVARDPKNYGLDPIAWSLVMILGAIFGITVGPFGLYHLYLVARNKTTIESMERGPTFRPANMAALERSGRRWRKDWQLSRAERKRLESASHQLHVYDLGVRENLRQVFGGWEDRWLWILPLGWPPGDGVYYPVDEARLQKLRDITAEIRYAEEPSSSPLYETSTGLATSQESELSDDDDDDSRRKQD